MENLIKHGPLDPVVPDNAPTPSNLDSITDKEYATPIDGHDVVLRLPLSEIRNANE